MNLKRDLELLYEIGCLRHLQRNWKQFLNPDFQNIPEHTLRVMWIALILAKHEKVQNHEKILKMALVHDLPESRTGDVNYLSRQYNKRAEGKAIMDILDNTVVGEEFVKLWKQYEKRESIESKIIKDADNLDADLELIEQDAHGHKLKDMWKERRRQYEYEHLYTKSAKKFWRAIYSSNPHDWHLRGRNRFNVGDLLK